MTNPEFLKQIRIFELEKAMKHFPGSGRILEIGAGAGWHSTALSEKGYRVQAIDLERSSYISSSLFPIKIYDGRHIPYPDRFFNVVFSSHTLEHIRDIPEFLREIERVLKKDGLSIHILPTSTWRIWTSIAHYCYILKFAFYQAAASSQNPNLSRLSHFQKLLKIILPHRHGETGNFVTEIFYFSKRNWKNIFQRTQMGVTHTVPAGLFFTGYSLLGSILPLGIRHMLSRFLGSSSRIYILRNDAIPVRTAKTML